MVRQTENGIATTIPKQESQCMAHRQVLGSRQCNASNGLTPLGKTLHINIGHTNQQQNRWLVCPYNFPSDHQAFRRHIALKRPNCRQKINRLLWLQVLFYWRSYPYHHLSSQSFTILKGESFVSFGILINGQRVLAIGEFANLTHTCLTFFMTCFLCDYPFTRRIYIVKGLSLLTWFKCPLLVQFLVKH